MSNDREPNKAQRVYWRVINDQLALATMPSTEADMKAALTRRRAKLNKAERDHAVRVKVSRDEWDDYVNETLADLLRYRGQAVPAELERETRPSKAAWPELDA